ncbi:M23 family metallopeptidase [Paenibacillus beijingensis]|uniref:M23ase beta-sheet core domain-containing protein n=1 Tax=Paenibacillus beijingensis TaxID=1126833 RepID=A0A0D5NGZ0_9BACL|nr:M23 family metallopeptidase [Paenibacillus beijingensis]AJY74551.1 hypothetical protein VN24_08155 [Paenibacillus beijingensis]
MNETNQSKQGKEETPKTVLGGRAAVKSSGLKRTLSKKWVSPAVFIAAAAIIVTLMWIYQGADQKTSTTESASPAEVSQGSDTKTGGEKAAEPAATITESLQWPVASFKDMKVLTPFYDASASEEERQAAMVQEGNTFVASTGIDITSPDGLPFDVLASAAGKVTLVDNHPTSGNEVEITSADGLVTVYQSLSDVQVKVGDEVAQGTVIAKSGRSEAGKDLGNHLRYTTLQNGVPVNPSDLIKE